MYQIFFWFTDSPIKNIKEAKYVYFKYNIVYNHGGILGILSRISYFCECFQNLFFLTAHAHRNMANLEEHA